MKRKELKKIINNSVGLLINDCILYKVVTKNADAEKADILLRKLIGIHQEFRTRVNVTEGKEVKNRVKLYYKKLKNDFQIEINRIGNDLQALS